MYRNTTLGHFLFVNQRTVVHRSQMKKKLSTMIDMDPRYYLTLRCQISALLLNSAKEQEYIFLSPLLMTTEPASWGQVVPKLNSIRRVEPK